MNEKDIKFARNLVKGKIAETIFAQMLRSTGNFTVLEFGYEKIIPELIQQGNTENLSTLEVLRTAPDFAVINKITKEVHLIEIKYRHSFLHKDVLKIAQKMSANWNPSYLFLASAQNFYFGEVREIIKKKGKIEVLNHQHIPKDTQATFHKMLNDFEV